MTPAVLIAIADNKSRNYGQSNPPLTVSFIGFVNGENTNVLNALPVASTTATNTSAPGNYPILLSGGIDDNYSLVLSNGILAVAAPGPVFISSAVFLDADHLRLRGQGDANVGYVIQASPDLVQWSALGTAPADGAGFFEYVDDRVSGLPQRFYRVSLP